MACVLKMDRDAGLGTACWRLRTPAKLRFLVSFCVAKHAKRSKRWPPAACFTGVLCVVCSPALALAGGRLCRQGAHGTTSTTARSGRLLLLIVDVLHPRLLCRTGQLIQARVMTLFGLSAADPRGNLEGVAAISTQAHLPILELPCNAISRHCDSLTQRNRLASGRWALVLASRSWAPVRVALRRRPRLSEPPTDGRRVAHAGAGFEKTRSQCGPKLFAVGSSSQIVHCTRYTLQPVC